MASSTIRRWWRGLPAGLILASVIALSSETLQAQAPPHRPWLGVAMDPAADGEGVTIGHVVRGSPAAAGGLHDGDRLLRVAGAAVARGADVVRAVSSRSVGDAIDLLLARGGREQLVRVVLAAQPTQDEIMRLDLVGAAAPELRDVQPASGRFPARLGELRGRVVLLDFWATWCAPCRLAAPRLDALETRHATEGLTVLGLSGEEVPGVAAFAQQLSLRYGMASDPKGHTGRAYGVVSLPTLVLIDRRGVVRDVAVGYDQARESQLEALVSSLLAEPAPAN